jgi:hypothetical protein
MLLFSSLPFDHSMYIKIRLFVCLLFAAGPAHAADYYVSSAGADSNMGTSAAAPWRTLARVNAVALRAGDRVLLRADDTFPGTLTLDSGDTGSAASPIVITSYGSGRATIWAGTGGGVWVYNTAGVTIANLAVAGAGGAASGINFYTDLPAAAPLPFIRIDAVDVGGFGLDGIEIGAWFGAAGFADVRVTNTTIHHNGRNGLLTYADRPNVHRQLYVGHVRAYENPGTPGLPSNSGSGIVLGSVDGGTIERSVAHDNGRFSEPGGPVGIWTYDSRRIVIQYNESYRNRTATTMDGGGFDLDQNVSDSIVQYNYSHDNDGGGFMLAQSVASDAHARNVIRFNVSQDDGRANGYGAIEIWGRVRSAEIYNNTVFVSTPAAGSPPAVRVWNSGLEDRFVAGVHVRNNIFVTSGLPVVRVTAAALSGASDLRFEGNAYYSGQAAPVFQWGAPTFTGLAAWRATGQESVSGTATGFSIDPQLTAPGAGPAIGNADQLVTLDAYRLRPQSPVADAGLDLRARFGIGIGSTDFYGGPLGLGTGFAIGAHEVPDATGAGIEEIVLYTGAATTISGAWRRLTDASAAGGTRLTHPDAGRAKLVAPLASPTDYFELTFEADAGTPYRLWMRVSAEGNVWSNDSIFAQFSDTVDAAGLPVFRIGTSSATTINLEDDTNAGVLNWGWQDNGWGTGVMGPTLIFATSGLHTIRVQTREDGVSIDQIVLSARRYLTGSPGPLESDATILALDGGPAPVTEIVIHAGTLPSSALHGNWTIAADPTAASGLALANPDRRAAKLTAPVPSPASYVDVPFSVQAGVPYHVWIRMRAEGNSYANDSIYVQLTGAVDAAGRPVARLGTADGDAVVLQDYDQAPISGWGWNDNGWAAVGTPYVFAQAGPQTLRIQQREDGVAIDQIVISPAIYLTTPPGAAINDTTIIRR